MAQLPKNKRAQQLLRSIKNVGIDRIVVSPGSRNAPLIIGFESSDYFELYSIVDERSAGFFALGMAQQLRKPVALLCTSGSALLNYYPAVAEAFYSNIPLVVISADRPDHLIDIGDGQTIRQKGVLNQHVLTSTHFSRLDQAEEVQKALTMALQEKGPVHINIPFDEPLYELVEEDDELPKINYVTKQHENFIKPDEIKSLISIWNSKYRKLILVGEHFPDPKLKNWLLNLTRDPSVLVLIENTANVSDDKFINSIDKLIFPFNEEELDAFRPDILLSLGGMIVSKKIKQHLRKYKPQFHWHIDPKRAFDTFHCLTKHIKCSTEHFFSQFLPMTRAVESNYQQYWLQRKGYRIDRHNSYLNTCPYSDLKVFQKIMEVLPEEIHLQLGNSSVIRYTQLFDLDPSVHVFCNRGTSGIDGSTSTAIGAATIVNRKTVFISGDVSFFYDSNALWIKTMPHDFRIVVINNGGGGIFRFIPGPSDTAALDRFETPHDLDASYLCDMHGINYDQVKNEADLEEKLSVFMNAQDGPSLLEIFTPRSKNDVVLRDYFNFLKQQNEI
jgi:2-succinyl-5-enolpyruvyl-6-hydroxy-3-cyclohexene-1-carboxylate synthase